MIFEGARVCGGGGGGGGGVNTKTNSLCVQTHLAIKLFLIMILLNSLLIAKIGP